MCTILVSYNPADLHPLALMANRDEDYQRASGKWAWRGSDRQYFAPIDEVAGGSWIGLNRTGLLIALTNIFPPAELDNPRSRGALVIDALAHPSAELAKDGVADAIEQQSYNNFNLLIADTNLAFVVTWNARQLAINRLEPGLHELVNTPFSVSGTSNLDLPNHAWLEENEARLSSHPAICRHGEKYGTRCSHKILVGQGGATKQVWHLEGHPCEGKFVQVLSEE